MRIDQIYIHICTKSSFLFFFVLFVLNFYFFACIPNFSLCDSNNHWKCHKCFSILKPIHDDLKSLTTRSLLCSSLLANVKTQPLQIRGSHTVCTLLQHFINSNVEQNSLPIHEVLRNYKDNSNTSFEIRKPFSLIELHSYLYIPQRMMLFITVTMLVETQQNLLHFRIVCAIVSPLHPKMTFVSTSRIFKQYSNFYGQITSYTKKLIHLIYFNVVEFFIIKICFPMWKLWHMIATLKCNKMSMAWRWSPHLFELLPCSQ